MWRWVGCWTNPASKNEASNFREVEMLRGHRSNRTYRDVDYTPLQHQLLDESVYGGADEERCSIMRSR